MRLIRTERFKADFQTLPERIKRSAEKALEGV
jgi:hypothetical protein